MVWLVNKIRQAQIDSVISANSPNEEEDPILYEIVKEHTVYESDEPVSKKSPKSLQNQNSTSDTGNPKYCLCPLKDGQTATVRNHKIDSNWVVLYNSLADMNLGCAVLLNQYNILPNI